MSEEGEEPEEEYMEREPPTFQSVEPNQGTGYDDEWTRFLDSLARDTSMIHIVEYLSRASLTDRAKERLMIYTRTLLDTEFAVSRIRDENDLTRVFDDKNLVDADLPLELTVFDMTAEFQHALNLLRIKFGIKVRRSIGGYERGMIATQRTEAKTEEVRPQARTDRSIQNKVRSLFR